MLAHQGGWDELLLPMAVVAIVFLAPSLLRHRRAAAEARTIPGTCAYCGEPFGAGARRCSSCGFRAVPS
jgi:hypothetical protein